MMGFEQTVTAQEQDTGVVLNDSVDYTNVDYTILFHSKKKKEVNWCLELLDKEWRAK